MELTPSEQKAIRLKKLKEDYKKAKEKNEKSGLFGSRVRSLKSKIEKLGGTVAAPKPSKPKKSVSKEEKEKRANKQLLPGLGTKSKEKLKENAKKEKKAQKGRDFKDGNAGLKPLPEGKTVKEIPEPKALKSTAKPGPAELASDDPVRKSKERSRRERDVISKSAGSKKENIGKQLSRALSGGQKKSKVGRFTVDSTDEGMSKFMGTKEEIRRQMEEEEMDRNMGGSIKKTYGMRAGGFTKKGGMYKKGY